MKEFKFSYDEDNDDLFVYLSGAKSKGAVEIGNFVFDFDEKENLVAIQILEAKQVLSKLLSKIIELTKIKEMRANIVNFRNMTMIRLEISTDSEKESISMPIPRIKEQSPALSY